MASPDDFQGEPTKPTIAGGSESTSGAEASPPEFLGRYRIEKVVAKGGYGVVYRAWDEQLNRSVAVKVLNTDSVSPDLHHRFLEEARIVAGLDHSNIVPVYDIGQFNSGQYYIVSRLVDGSDLNKRMQQYKVSQKQTLQIVADIASALHYAHSKGLVHRDVKPANILIDSRGHSYLTDFGIALREQSIGVGSHFVGTPEYMSPEQIRGESHRVDHRSDIFSLGLIMYRLLTGRLPFVATSDEQLMELITTEDIRTPRVYNELIGVDIERVCMKALARRPNDRYSVAMDFSEDIQWILASRDFPSDSDHIGNENLEPIKSARPTSNIISPATKANRHREIPKSAVTHVVPKGLRSYDENDADFYFKLLPGPYDRNGVPESIRSWFNKLSNRHKGAPMAMAIYGPSGCGKSSLIQAGVLPKLTDNFICIAINATPNETESHLKTEIRTIFPTASGNSLAEILASIRRNHLIQHQGKLILVIDQFEQWLAERSEYAGAELTEAIRQCDGSNIQAVFSIRDDFWVPLNRFFKELEIPLVDGLTCELVDLFSKSHAAKVLGLFGVALEKLPAVEAQWTEQQRLFIERSIESLSEDGKIVPVKLSLYTDTIKSREWNLSSIKEIGGIEGVGLSFLTDSFNSKYSKPEYRQHVDAAQKLLTLLLPPKGFEIKGVFKPASELKEACGYADKPQQFDSLINILDRNLRLITAVDSSDIPGVPQGQTSYQLTHDYLVPSLREWLTRNKRTTPKGRAELVLDECSRIWIVRKEEKLLPTFWETCSILFHTKKKEWTKSQAKMMRSAKWYHGERAVFLLIYLTLFSCIALGVRYAWFEQIRISRIQERIRQLKSIDPSKLSDIVDDPTWTPAVISKYLSPIYSSEPDNKKSRFEQLHSKLVAVKSDKSLVLPLREELLNIDDLEYLTPLCKALSSYSNDLRDDLIVLFKDESASPKRRFHAAIFLLKSTKMEIAKNWDESDFSFIANQLLLANSEYQPILRELLKPIAPKLTPAIELAFLDKNSDLRIQESAAYAFKDYAQDDLMKVSELVAKSNTRQFEILFPLIQTDPSGVVIGNLSSIVGNLTEMRDTDIFDRIKHGKYRATASIGLALLGEYRKISPLFDSADNPEAISQFIHLAKKEGVSGADVMSCIKATNSFNGNSIALYAFLSLLGDYAIEEIPLQDRNALVATVTDLYKNHPESKIHGIAYWLLRRWGLGSVIQEFESKNIPYSPQREWFQLSIDIPLSPELASETVKSKRFCYTFIAFQPGKYELGSREIDDPDRQMDEDVYISTITRPFAVLDREITFEEFLCFRYDPVAKEMTRFNADLDSAAFCTTWFDSVDFCRWLFKNIDPQEARQAYSDHHDLDTIQFPRDQKTPWAPLNWPIDISKPGFRLPMESEWEVAARGGSKARFSFGFEMDLLPNYAWFELNSGRRVHPPRELRPNMRGLFDLQGNVFEWCHGWTSEQRAPVEDDPIGPLIGSTRVDRGGGWYYGGTQCRPTFKYGDDPSLRGHNLGFRLAITLDPAWIEISKKLQSSD